MNSEELAIQINSVLEADTFTHERLAIEKKLFADALLEQQRTLNRTPSSDQIAKSWARWKRERFLDISAENVDLATLYRRK